MVSRKEIEDFLKTNTMQRTIEKYDKLIIAKNNPTLSIWFCHTVIGADIKSHEKIVLNSSNPRDYYNFAKLVKGANVKLLKEKALSSKDKNVILLFATNFSEYGIDAEQEFIMKFNDPEDAFTLAKIAGSDTKRLEQIVLNSKDYRTAYSFACEIEGANIQALEDMVVKSKDPVYIFLFAKDVVGANKARLLKTPIEIGNPNYIVDYSVEVEEVEYNIIKNLEFNDPITNETMHNYCSYKKYVKSKI